ncbi:class I SAM-dependent methyltransferase [Streptomyces sp. NPDC090106]|uniref:class I SAM-dependent methyltransferase n=1 Tax=Streptomyces sp. NPDC090106 TaxID=3365946 RepID=UPI0037FFFA1B
MATYDSIGTAYAGTRRPDPRIAARIHRALADAATVVNVGAGTGSYEPAGTVWAVEPSAVMIAQRPPGSAPALRAGAEAIPLPDDSADAAMALLTVHHWDDLERGIDELRRVARRRIVVLTFDPAVSHRFWLLDEYLPEAASFDAAQAVTIDRLVSLLGGARVETVPVPHDCTDGFLAAYWRRPEAYLDPRVRAGISLFAQIDDSVVRPGLDRLRDDLSTGRWHHRHADLLDRDTMDAGYRLLVGEVPA